MRLERRIVRSFLEAHPREAARTLERMDETEALAVLEESDAPELAAVLRALVPSTASKHLAKLDPSLAGRALTRLEPERAADLLRRLPGGRRRELLDELGKENRLPVERLLRFPLDTAGALMQPQFVAYHHSREVEEALSELKEQGTELRYYVYVVDDDLVLVGVLSVREMVAAAPGSRLKDVMRRPVQTLSARAGRSAILRHPGWNRFPALPVVDERGRLVGVFLYRTFQDLKRVPGGEANPSALGLALALGELFWWGASSLFRGLERTDDGDSGR